MKNYIKALALFAAVGFSGAALAAPVYTVTINDGYYGQNQSISFTQGVTGNPRLVGDAAIYGTPFNLFFTQVGSNVILSHLFAPGGSPVPGAGDNIYFSATGMNDAFLGTTCKAGQVCLGLTGAPQDVSANIIAQIGADHWCGGGGTCNVTVQAKGIEVPEPSSIALLGLGLFGFASARRKSAGGKNA
jgi:hypothetical protein